MPKFLVFEVATASYLVGEYHASSKEEAMAMAEANPQNDQPILCHQCASEVELGDFYKFQVDEV